MTNYVPLTHTAHQQAGVGGADMSFAQEQAVVPVVAQEIPQLLPTMAMAFVQDKSTQGFRLVAIQALEPANNVYVHTNGRWIGGYRPAWYRAWPFSLAPDPDSSRMILCVNDQASCFHSEAEPGDRALYTENEQPTDFVKNLMEFLKNYERNRQATQTAVDLLANSGLMTPWKIETRKANNGEVQPVTGLFRIDEKALRELEPSVLAPMVQNGALSIAYSQLLSEHRIGALSRLYELRSASRNKKKPVEELDIETLFADNDEDDLKF